jgi:hypothetical protein
LANRNDPFFSRLTKLFRSGPAIQRRVKGYDYKSYYDNQLVRGNLGYRGPFPFGRESSPFSVLGAYGILDRMARYAEFAEMEYQPEIAAALNIFADETAAGDEKGKAFHLYSKNPEVKKALEELFYDILNIDFNLRPWIRNLVKYGDFFLYNEVIPDIGIVNVQPIPVNELEREEGFDQHDPYAVRFKWLTRGNRYLENWQITHMRVLGNDLFLPYGTSILEPARRIWRQLIMMEDSMLVYRVVRSPERRVFYIDVGNVAPNDVPSYMEAVKQTMRSRDVVDRTSGRMDQRYNPLSIDEDYFIPVRGGQTGTKIETLAGGQNATAVDDVKYLQQKLFAAIQVPKPYLNFDENLSAKASLAQQDVRFSRTISVLQRVILSELNKMAMIHLYSKGFDGDDLISFELKLSNPSTVAMQQKLEAMSTKFDIAGKAKETKLVDQDWIQKKILDLTDDDIIKIEAGIRRDKIREVEIEAVAVKENLPQKNTTTDPFDPSNYVMPGADVKKNAPLGEPIGGSANTSVQPTNITADMQAVATSGVSVAGQPSASPDAAGGLPIKATPFLSSARHNDRRRVGMAGRSNLSMPDFKDMLSGNNKYMTDINDKETLNLKSQFSLSEDTKSSDIELEYKPPPVVSRDMKYLMTKLDDHFARNGGRKNRKILTENEVKLDDLRDEPLFEMDMIGDDILIENTDKNNKTEENDDLDLSNID